MMQSILSATSPPTATTAPVKEAARQVSSSATSLGEQFRRFLPLLVIAILIVIVGYAFMRAIRRPARRAIEKRYDHSVAVVTTRLVSWAFMLIVFLFALAVTFPSISAGDIVGSLGFVSVAVGFAFRDILENSLAGLLLLIRKPFTIGDQIEVVEIFGTAEEISIRETRIRQRDGQIIVIPNRDVYKNNIRVQTENPLKRFEFYLEFDYVTNVGDFIDTIVAGIAEVDGVAAAPPPKGRIDDTGSEMLTCKFMGWAKSDQSSFNDCRNRAIQHTLDVMTKHKIPLPNDVQHYEIVPEAEGGNFRL